MASTNEVAIKIKVDKADAETNVRAFQAAFTKFLVSIGKTPEEVIGFYHLFAEIKNGTKSINDLEGATKALMQEFKIGFKMAEGADFLGISRAEKLNALLASCQQRFGAAGAAGKKAGADTGNAFRDAAQQATTLKEKAEQIAAAFNEVKGAVAGTVAATVALQQAVKRSIEFEESLAKVQAIAQTSEAKLEELGRGLVALSNHTGESTRELAALAAQGARFGFPVEKLEEFTRLAAMMAQTFNLSNDEVAQSLGALRNQYNLTIPELEGFANEIFAVGKAVGASAGDIFNVVNRVSAATKQFGLSRQETLALTASLLSMGVTAGLADNNINAFLLRLRDVGNATGDAADALYSVGIKARDLGKDIREHPQQALLNFMETMRELPKTARADVLGKVFGREYADDAERMINALDRYKKGLTAVGEEAQNSGALMAAHGARMETTAQQFERISQTITNLQKSIGDTFLPVVRPTADAIADMGEALSNFAENHPEITAIATALATLATIAGGVKTALWGIETVGRIAFPAAAAGAAGLAERLAGATAAARLLGTVLTGSLKLALGGWMAWDFGKYLYENIEGVRRLAGFMIEQLVRGASDVEYAWDLAWAAFTDDTAEGALKRYEERTRQLDETFRRMYEGIKEGTYKGKQSMSELADEQEKAAKEAEKAREKERKAEEERQKEAEKRRRDLQDLREDMQKLGLDAEVFTTGMTRAEREVVDAFERMSASGQASADAIMAGFKSGLEKVSTSALPAMELAIHDAFSRNKISADQLDTALALIARRAKDISQDMHAVNEASKALGLDASIALGGMSEKAEEAARALELLIEKQLVTKNNFQQVFDAALKAADSTAAVDRLRGALELLRKQFPELAPQIEKAMTLLKQKADEVTPGINSVTEAMEKLGLKSESSLKLAAQNAREMYEKVRAMGGTIEDQRQAWLKYAEAAITANRGAASMTVKAEAAALGLKRELNELVEANRKAKGSTDALRDSWKAKADVMARATKAVQAHGTAMVAAAQHALEMAKIQGDTLEIERATVAVREAEATAARELADALAAEAASAWSNVAAMKEKAAADGLVTEAEKEMTQAAMDAATALSQQADAAKRASEKADAASKAATDKQNEVRTATIQWDALAVQYGLAANEGGKLAETQGKIWAGMQKVYSTGFGGLDGYIDAINAAAERAGQFVHAMHNVENAARGGDASLGQYIRSLQRAIQIGSIMGEEEMRPLRDALKDAKERMRGLQESARDTLNSLRDELDEMHKNYDEIEKRRYAERRAELQAQIAIAKSAGNNAAVADLQRALALLDQVSKERIKEAAARERDDKRSLKGEAGIAAEAATDRIVTKVVDINIKVGEDTGTAQVVEGGEEVIVDMLRKAQMVAS
jgi:TP901 family phage tail tape measure protein